MAPLMPIFMLASRSQRLDSLVTYITGVNHLYLVCFVPNTDPIQQQPSQTRPLYPRSRCQQMSTPLYLLLKAYHSLEDNLTDNKADSSVCHQLGQVSVLQYFWGVAGSMDHQHVFWQARLFFENILPLWLHCSGKQGRVASGRGSCASGVTR